MSDAARPVDAIAKAATWLVAAYASMAAVIVAGLQLSGFDRARSPLLMLVAYLVGLGSAIAVVVSAAKVLMPEFSRAGDLRRFLTQQVLDERARGEVGRGPPLDSAEDRLVSRGEIAFLVLGQERIEWMAVGVEGSDVVDAKALDAVNAEYARQRYEKLRWVAMISGMTIAFAVPLFSWASIAVDGSIPSMSNPVPVTVELDESMLADDSLPASCDRSQFDAVLIGDDPDVFELLVAPYATCPGGYFEIPSGNASVDNIDG